MLYDLKQCQHCFTFLEKKFFSRNKNYKDGLEMSCKRCCKKYAGKVPSAKIKKKWNRKKRRLKQKHDR